MSDQKSVTAPEKRLTGGLDGVFFCGLIFVLCGLAQPDAWACAGLIYAIPVVGVASSRHDPHPHEEWFWSSVYHSDADVSAP